MASSSGDSTCLQEEMNERKRKRMVSNRESARRSRQRKQRHLDDLTSQVSQLRKENAQMLNVLNLTTSQYLSVEAENSVLRTQMMELSSRLQGLNDILSCCCKNSDSFNGGGNDHDGDDGMMMMMMMKEPWSMMMMMNDNVDMLYQYC